MKLKEHCTHNVIRICGSALNLRQIAVFYGKHLISLGNQIVMGNKLPGHVSLLFCRRINMPHLTKDQRVWICLEYGRVNNACEVLRRWAERWGDVPAPTKRTVMQTYGKFVHEGTCLNVNKGRSGRRRTARTAANIEMVRQSLMENGLRSGRRNGFGLSRTTFEIIRRHKLREGDPVQRLDFCNRLVTTVAQIPDFLDKLVVSDEAMFSLNSEINSRNVRKYAAKSDGHPNDHYVAYQQGEQQIMVWVGLTRQGAVLGPHFVEGNLDAREYIRIKRDSKRLSRSQHRQKFHVVAARRSSLPYE